MHALRKFDPWVRIGMGSSGSNQYRTNRSLVA
jgi:hypothetical protein